MASSREIRLLDYRPRALLNGKEPAGLHTRTRKLLVCMALMPDDHSRWGDLAFDRRRAKSQIKGVLGSGWIDPAEGAYRLSPAVHIDLDRIPVKDDSAAFSYCVQRGDLLPEPEYAEIEWITDARLRYHQRLARITTRLCERASPEARDAYLDRAARVLSRAEIEEVRRSAAPPPAVTAQKADDIEITLSALEAQMGEPANGRAVARSLRDLVMGLEQQATSWRPARKEVLDRASMLIHFYRQLFDFDAEALIWNLANSRMYAGDTWGAFAELRPWMADPAMSAGALCIAGLLNLRLGWHDAAHAAYTAALERNASPEFEVILREKRDVELAQSRGQNAGETAQTLRLEPAFDGLSPGARASVYTNQATTTPRPFDAFRLFHRASEIDREAENPHYELNLARAARRIGEPEVARQHMETFEELLQTRRALPMTFARMGVRADEIVRKANAEGPDALQYRARLQEADALHQAIAVGRQRTSDIPGVCAALLARARIADALGNPEGVRLLARTVELLASDRAGRFETEAHRLAARATTQLDPTEKARLDRRAYDQATSIEAELPAPLEVGESTRRAHP
jgi:hypothetical protein